MISICESSRLVGLVLLSAALSGPAIAGDLDRSPASVDDSEGHTDSPFDLLERDGGAAIINGEAATRDDYPQTGGLLIDTIIDGGSWGSYPIQTFMCSSTLIAPDVVLIAAHCVDPVALTYGYGELVDTTYVWSRQADLSTYDASRTGLAWPDDAVVVADTVYHPDWDLFSLGLGLDENYDIALVFLSEPVLDVEAALLPTADEGAALAEGTEVAVVGWGQQVHVDGWGSPPAGTYMIKQQGMSHIAEIGAPEMQVGKEESDVRKCHGDSGGPSFAWVGQGTTETMRLVGVTSHAYDSSDCAETGGVDTRVDFYLDWIDSEMRARCEDGSRVWCDEPGILPTDYYEPVVADDSGLGDDGSDDGSDDGDEVDGSGGDGDKGGCMHAAGAMSGLGLMASLVAVARRRDD